jgi:hypothetical protein
MTDAPTQQPTIVCIASFFKGNEFLRECKRRGARAVLLTREKMLKEDWARIELATEDEPYELPPARRDYAGIAVSLARQEWPDTSAYDDPEIVFRVRKPWHVGLVVRSADYARMFKLLENYRRRFAQDFLAVAPPEETPEQHL